jgi:hypothetical protein
MDWPLIVGREIAACSAPERLKWPPREPAGEAGETPPRRRATLVLRVDGARALDLHYQSRQILERINAYFGYAAVSDLRLLQAPLAAPPPAAGPGRAPPRGPAPELPQIADVALREALRRLGAHLGAHAGEPTPSR